jgi:hypothetical protein
VIEDWSTEPEALRAVALACAVTTIRSARISPPKSESEVIVDCAWALLARSEESACAAAL